MASLVMLWTGAFLGIAVVGQVTGWLSNVFAARAGRRRFGPGGGEGEGSEAAECVQIQQPPG
jgi:hypothetical protein